MKQPPTNPSESLEDALHDDELLEAFAGRLTRSPAQEERLRFELEERTKIPARDVTRLIAASRAVAAASASTAVTPPQGASASASSSSPPAGGATSSSSAAAAGGGGRSACSSGMTLVPAPAARPLIEVGRPLRDVAQDANDVLLQANQPEILFRTGGGQVLVRLSRDGEGRLEPLTFATLAVHWSEIADWVRRMPGDIKKGKPDTFKPVEPTPTVVKAALDEPPARLPVVNSVKWTPYLGARGELVTTPGYQERDKAFLMQDSALVVAPVSSVPTEPEVTKSLDILRTDLFVDFPFVTPADCANMLGFFLSPFVMAFISACGGTAPLIVLEAAVYGSGKTLLGNLVALVATGRSMYWRSFPGDEAERQKSILTAAIEGAQFIAFDNAKGEVGGEAIEGALTTSTLSGRLLGTNKEAGVTNTAVWAMTGNNATLSPDMVRRAVRVRIDAGVEDPTKGRTFKHEDITGWALANRADLVHAALTLIQNWVAKGRPPFSKKPRASFEAWSRTLGGILECAGVEAFLGEEASLEAASSEKGEATAFVEAWHAELGEEEVTAKQMLEKFVAPPVSSFGEKRAPAEVEYLESALAGVQSARASKLGRWLKAHVDRVFGNYRIQRGRDDTHAKAPRYRLERVSGGVAPPTAAVPEGGEGATTAASSDGDFGLDEAAK